MASTGNFGITSRPFRVPDGVPLGSVEPPTMTAGAMETHVLTVTLPKALAGDALVLWSGGHRWVKLEIPMQNAEPAREGYVSARVVGGPALKPVVRLPPTRIEDLMRVGFEIPKGSMPKGTTIRIVLGDRSMGSPGAMSPQFSIHGAFLALTLEPRPPSLAPHDLNWVAAFPVDVVGGPLKRLRVLAPSCVKRGQEFSLTIRPQDDHGNISPQAPRRVLLRLEGVTYERRITTNHLNPAGAIEIKGLKLARNGVARIEVRDPDAGLVGTSNPILVGNHGRRLLWGLIHEHTELSDGLGSPDLCYLNMRFGSKLDFGSVTDHDHRFETSDEMWELARQAAIRHHKPGFFITFLGYEWAKWRRNGDGDRNVYYPGDDGEMLRSETGEYDRPFKLFQALAGTDALIIPHHTAYAGNFCDWTQHDPVRERLVEVYSVWGSSEMGRSDGNPFPVRDPKTHDPLWLGISGKSPPDDEVPVGFVQNALAQGWRVGFTAGGDMHRSQPGDDATRGHEPYRYRPGLTALWAEKKTRRSIWTSLKSRCCYATTGSRMVLWMSLNGKPMGSEILTDEGEPRIVEFEAHCEDDIATVELVRNNKVLVLEKPGDQEDVCFRWEDHDRFRDIALPPSVWCPKLFTFYYVRVRQADGETGWTSPVWVEERP